MEPAERRSKQGWNASFSVPGTKRFIYVLLKPFFSSKNFGLYLLIKQKWKQIPSFQESFGSCGFHSCLGGALPAFALYTHPFLSSALISSTYSKGSIEDGRKASWLSVCFGLFLFPGYSLCDSTVRVNVRKNTRSVLNNQSCNLPQRPRFTVQLSLQPKRISTFLIPIEFFLLPGSDLTDKSTSTNTTYISSWAFFLKLMQWFNYRICRICLYQHLFPLRSSQYLL